MPAGYRALLRATLAVQRRVTPGITWKDCCTWLVRKETWPEPELVRLSLLTASTNSPEVSGRSLSEASPSARVSCHPGNVIIAII